MFAVVAIPARDDYWNRAALELDIVVQLNSWQISHLAKVLGLTTNRLFP